MAESKLDQIVKGAPPPDTNLAELASTVISHESSAENTTDGGRDSKNVSQTPSSDPTSDVHSSPPQIYLNLLILEASLRSQYLALQARRRLHVFFLTLLGLWNVYFFYVLFFQPREDGSVGGSVYWVVDMAEKVAFMGGILTAVLVWGTGQLERGLRWPRRWLAHANRGLRQTNLKLVVIKGPWWRQLFSHLSVIFPYSSFKKTQGSTYQYVEYAEKRSSNSNETSKYTYRNEKYRGIREEDLAKGGDRVKLLLLPKYFSSEFRENWEIYRTEYWEQENIRRSELRSQWKARQRELAKQEGRRWWWSGRSKQFDLQAEAEKALQQPLRPRKNSKRRKPSIALSAPSHSRSSSRSSVYSGTTPEAEDLSRGTGSMRLRSKGSSTRSTRSQRSLAMTDMRDDTEGGPLWDKRSSMVNTAAESLFDKRASMMSLSSDGTSDGESGDRPVSSSASFNEDREREDRPSIGMAPSDSLSAEPSND